MADLGIGPWGEEPTFHAPCFVVTHRPAETIVTKGGTSYTFVTDGIEAALERAREAAGPQDVQVNGGADVAQRFLNAGLLDEIRLHLVPIFLGAGTRLFDGVRTDVRLVPREARNQPAVIAPGLRGRASDTEPVARLTWPTRGDNRGGHDPEIARSLKLQRSITGSIPTARSPWSKSTRAGKRRRGRFCRAL
jgi:dihydrofolate reductase